MKADEVIYGDLLSLAAAASYEAREEYSKEYIGYRPSLPERIST